MAKRKHKINWFLFFLTFLLCLGYGVLLTRSTAIAPGTSKDSLAQAEADSAGGNQGDDPTASAQDAASGVEEAAGAEEDNTEEETVAEESAESEESFTYEVSAEASIGVWTSSGSSWLFMVNGAAYTGWLTDTDHHRYYFNAEGIMQTGWLDDGENRYYLDEDGIMQTGEITVDGVTYILGEDGILKE
ncbi:MAG: cell wall-binding protein [Clostridiales bacterium]|nr:cell wall-binding protein [Clostridiales bacterium]